MPSKSSNGCFVVNLFAIRLQSVQAVELIFHCKCVCEWPLSRANRGVDCRLQIRLQFASKPSKPSTLPNWFAISNQCPIGFQNVQEIHQTIHWMFYWKFVYRLPSKPWKPAIYFDNICVCNLPPSRPRPSRPGHLLAISQIRLQMASKPSKPSNCFSIANLLATDLQAVQAVQAVHWIPQICLRLVSELAKPSKPSKPKIWCSDVRLFKPSKPTPKPCQPSKPSIGFSMAQLFAIGIRAAQSVQTVEWMFYCTSVCKLSANRPSRPSRPMDFIFWMCYNLPPSRQYRPTRTKRLTDVQL